MVTLWRVGHVQKIAAEALAVSKKTEVNTNSMSERLGLASHAAGMVEGAEAERARSAALKAAEDRGRADVAADKTTITADQIVTDKIVTSGKDP